MRTQRCVGDTWWNDIYTEWKHLLNLNLLLRDVSFLSILLHTTYSTCVIHVNVQVCIGNYIFLFILFYFFA